jgi:hypothetical protein
MSALPPKADMHRAVSRKIPAETIGMRFRFLGVGLCRKTKHNRNLILARGAQGRGTETQENQRFWFWVGH